MHAIIRTVSVLPFLVISGAAYSADPILVAEPVNYVRVCNAFGDGFMYIPGSNTCLKMSGYVFSEASWVSTAGDSEETYYTTLDFVGGDELIAFGITKDANDPRRPVNQFGPNFGPGGLLTVPTLSADLGGNFVGDVQVDSSAFDNFTTRIRGNVEFDARTETDIGLLQALVELRGTIGHNDVSDDFTLENAYMILSNDAGTFTAGLITTFYNFFGGYSLDSRIGGDDPSDEVNLFGYTRDFGRGFSASISIEDRRFRQNESDLVPVGLTPSAIVTLAQQSLLMPPGSFGGTVPFLTGFSYDGQETPDLVGNLHWDGTWGSAQVMGAIRQVSGGFSGADLITGAGLSDAFGIPEGIADDIVDLLGLPGFPAASGDELGWVVGAGLTVNVPNSSVVASTQVSYTEGMTGYVTTGNGAALADALMVGTYQLDCSDNGGISCSAGTSYDLDLTKAWSVVAGLEANLTPTVQFRLNGTFADIDHAGAYFDYQTWTAATTLVWTPVKNLTFAGELSYENVDGDVFIGGTDPAISLPVPVGIGDGDIWGALFQVELTF